jgi:hypothetical protein
MRVEQGIAECISDYVDRRRNVRGGYGRVESSRIARRFGRECRAKLLYRGIDFARSSRWRTLEGEMFEKVGGPVLASPFTPAARVDPGFYRD